MKNVSKDDYASKNWMETGINASVNRQRETGLSETEISGDAVTDRIIKHLEESSLATISPVISLSLKVNESHSRIFFFLNRKIATVGEIS